MCPLPGPSYSIGEAVFFEFIVFTTPLSSARQHLSCGDCPEVKRKYYQNCSVLDCVTQCLQSAHLSEQFLQLGSTGPIDWVCHIGPFRHA